MIVPVSEAVAKRVPSLLRAMQDSGERWASMTLTAFKVIVSKIKTSPEVGGTYVERGGACAGRRSPVSSLGLGKGYAI